MSISIKGKSCGHLFFAGIFGSGMSALAQYLRWQGLSVSGSDRLLNSQDTRLIRERLAAIGCRIVEQDGTGIDASVDVVCVSTAIEETNPDIAAARALAIPVVHRSDVLAGVVGTRRTVAVAGTSGKSTVTAMIFEFLSHCGKSPSLISGAPLRRLERSGYIGNAFSGESDLLVIEADESDGSLVKYVPALSVFLNVSKDHKPVEETLELFRILAAKSSWTATNADDPVLRSLQSSQTFGLSETAVFHPQSVAYGPRWSSAVINDTEYVLPLPGAHNLSNLLAALCACAKLDCASGHLVAAVKNYEGVDRRFAVTHTMRGATVIDDFAHNPEKIRAAVTAARGISKRLFIIYQPHGFGPTRFLKEEYARVFKEVLTESDSLYLLPIYYAGGTAQKDISSDDLVSLMGTVAFDAHTPRRRDETIRSIMDRVHGGDCVLLMGARDPSLSSFAGDIVSALGGPAPEPMAH